LNYGGLEDIPLMRVELPRRLEESLRYECHGVSDLCCRPDWTKKCMRCLPEGLYCPVRRHRFDQRVSVKASIGIQQLPPLGYKIRIPEIKWAVEIPQVSIPEAFEYLDGIAHRSSWQSEAEARRATGAGMFE
jgi:hypothetical protein